MSLHQGYLIPKINQYMAHHGISLRLPDKGVCHGLSLLHASYFLKSEEESFFYKLECILNPKPENKDEIDTFCMELIAKILILQNPEDFTPGKNQRSAENNIDNEMGSIFNFSMVGNDKNWCDILKKIALFDNEIIQVSSVSHSITISKSGRYCVYDSNYDEGRKYFESEEDLMTELRNTVFSYENKNIGLTLRILYDMEPQKNRSEIEFYQQFVNHENINLLATTKSHSFHTMCSAAQTCDEQTIQYLVNCESDYIYESLSFGIQANNDKVIPFLLEKLHSDLQKTTKALLNDKENESRYQTIRLLLREEANRVTDAMLTQLKLVEDALFNGCDKALHALIKDIPAALLEKMSDQYCLQAAYGGHLQSLQYCLDNIKKTKISDSDVFGMLSNAIKGRRLEIVHYLIENLPFDLTEDNKKSLLKLAIENNHYSIVDTLVNHEKTKPCAMESLSISLSTIKKTDVYILNALEKAGMTFTSFFEKSMMKKKKHIPIGRIESLGILFSSFFDFIKRKVAKPKHFFDIKPSKEDKPKDDPKISLDLLSGS